MPRNNTNINLTQDEIDYIDRNLKNKTIIKLARELSEARNDGVRIRRRHIIDFYKNELQRNILKEKFGK